MANVDETAEAFALVVWCPTVMAATVPFHPNPEVPDVFLLRPLRRVRARRLLVSTAGLLLLLPVASRAGMTLRPWEGEASGSAAPAVQAVESCDDGSVGGTLVQELEAWYGNAFVEPCSGARVTRVHFQHISYGLPGPYLYRLHLVDAACTVTAVTGLLAVEPSGDGPTWVEVDVSGSNWCISGEYRILLEPLTCADPLLGADCFPALAVDGTSTPEPGAHCAMVSTSDGFDRTCAAARSADGRYFDFLLRPEVECQAQACSSAVQRSHWSLVKSLYRTP